MICVATLTTGQWKENCYILSHRNGDAVVIDPGEDTSQITEHAKNNSLNIIAIVNTHAHYDHVASVEELRESYGAKFHLHSNDARLLTQANFYQKIFGGDRKIRIPPIDVDLAAQKYIKIGNFNIEVLHTPGHTEGSVSLHIENFIFTGDLILYGKSGRSDLPGGNASKLKISVQNLLSLPDQTLLFPGHGHPKFIHELRTSLSASENQR